MLVTCSFFKKKSINFDYNFTQISCKIKTHRSKHEIQKYSSIYRYFMNLNRSNVIRNLYILFDGTSRRIQSYFNRYLGIDVRKKKQLSIL